MKKTFIILTSLISTTALLFGCTNPAIPSAVGERLEYSLNALATTVKNLDTVDNLYLANPDVSPVINSDNQNLSLQAAPRKSQGKAPVQDMVAMVSSLNAYIEPFSVDMQPTVNQTVQTDENVVHENENTVSNIYEHDYVNESNMNDNNMVTTNQHNSQQVEYNNAVSDVNYNRVTVSESNRFTADNNVEKESGSVKNNNQMIETQNNNNTTDAEDTSYNSLNNGLVQNSNNSQTNGFNSIQTNDTVSEVTDNGRLPYIKSNTTDSEVKYQPRYIANNVAGDNGEHLTNYITKVKNLYAMTNDAIIANNTLTDSKNSLLTCIEDLKQLAIEMKHGSYEPTTQQISAINNYINDIKTTISRIRGTNGQLNNEINKINNYDKTGLTTSIDVLNSNYMRILNHIDVRITYLKNALATLEQVKSLLLEAQYLDQMEQQNALQQNELNNVEQINDINNMNNEFNNEGNLIENNNVIPAENEMEKEQTPTDNTNVIEPNVVLPEENLDTNLQEEEKERMNPALPLTSETGDDVNQNTQNTTYNDNKTVNKELAPIENANVDNNNQGETLTENDEAEVEIEKENYNQTTFTENEADKLTNIDTYSRANTQNSADTMNRYRARRNTDTYNDMPRIRNIPDNNINNANDNNNADNAGINNYNQNNMNDGTNINNANFNDMSGVNNGYANGVNGGMNDGINNGGVNNGGMNNGAFNNGGVTNFRNQNEINTPNGTFQNGIITQNNLNHGTNNGVNGVRTGYNGSSNNPYTVDAKGRNRNINTYGYNTLVDIINRGTVNNGINTLNLNMKPIENVNTEMEENFNVNATLATPQNGKQVQRILAN